MNTTTAPERRTELVGNIRDLRQAPLRVIIARAAASTASADVEGEFNSSV